MLWIIPSNFLKIGNGWAIVEKYAPTVVLVEAHFFPQFLENFRFHSNATSTLIFLEKKNTHLLNLKRIDNSTEKCGCKVNKEKKSTGKWSVHKEKYRKVKNKAEDFLNSQSVRED